MDEQTSESDFEQIDESDYVYSSSEPEEDELEELVDEHSSLEEEEDEADEPNGRPDFGTIVSSYWYPESRVGDLDPEGDESRCKKQKSRYPSLKRLLERSTPTESEDEIEAVDEFLDIMASTPPPSSLTEQMELLFSCLTATLDQLCDLCFDTPDAQQALQEILDDVLGYGWHCIWADGAIQVFLFCLAQCSSNIYCLRTASFYISQIFREGLWINKSVAQNSVEIAVLSDWISDEQVFANSVDLYYRFLELGDLEWSDIDKKTEILIFEALFHNGKSKISFETKKRLQCILAYFATQIPELRESHLSKVLQTGHLLWDSDLVQVWLRPNVFESVEFTMELEAWISNALSEGYRRVHVLLLQLYHIWKKANPEQNQTKVRTKEWFGHCAQLCYNYSDVEMRSSNEYRELVEIFPPRFAQPVNYSGVAENTRRASNQSNPTSLKEEQPSSETWAPGTSDRESVHKPHSAFRIRNPQTTVVDLPGSVGDQFESSAAKSGVSSSTQGAATPTVEADHDEA